MAKLGQRTGQVAVIFENTAFGTSTSNGLKNWRRAKASKSSCSNLFGGLYRRVPLINKSRPSGPMRCSRASYLMTYPDRADRQQVGLNIAITAAPALRNARFLQERRQAGEGRRRGARNHDVTTTPRM